MLSSPIVLGSFSFVLIYLFTAVYVCTITIISLLLASTIMTSSCLVVAFGVFPDLSPSAKQQITHIRAPCVSSHTRPLFPVSAVASFFSTRSFFQHKHEWSHRPLLMLLAVCPSGSALLSWPCFCVSSCPLVITVSVSLSTGCQ